MNGLPMQSYTTVTAYADDPNAFKSEMDVIAESLGRGGY